MAMKKLLSGCRKDQSDRSRPKDWSAYLAPDAPVASAEFMVGVEDLPLEERAFFAIPQTPSTRPKKRLRRTKSK
jgi:hypothetical protein